MDEEYLRDVILNIIHEADSTLADAASDVSYGELLAYSEVITILKEAIDPEEWAYYGLDFDEEEKYIV